MGRGSAETTNVFGNYRCAQGNHDSKKSGSICASHSLLVGSRPGGDGAGGETDAVQMSPGLPPVPAHTLCTQLEQSDQRRGQAHTTTKQNKIACGEEENAQARED